MTIFENLKVSTKWVVIEERFLTEEEKKFIKAPIVVEGKYCNSLKFMTPKGVRRIPISRQADVVIGYVPDINNIKIITLKCGNDITYRVEF